LVDRDRLWPRLHAEVDAWRARAAQVGVPLEDAMPDLEP